MKDFFKRVKADAIMSAVLCIALGVVLIVWPGETINIVCKVLAAGLRTVFLYYQQKRLYVHRNPWADRADRRCMDLLKTEQYREPGTDRDRCDTCCSRCAGCENGVRIKEWRI